MDHLRTNDDDAVLCGTLGSPVADFSDATISDDKKYFCLVSSLIVTLLKVLFPVVTRCSVHVH